MTQNEILYRQAEINDIPQIQIVRNSVRENMLSNPNLVTDTDCEEYITQRGRGWVAEVNQKIVGFAIVDLKDHNVWALFIHPDFEKQGIGRKLHFQMMSWYFSMTSETAWLSTSPGTRAEIFYRNAGWIETGIYGKGEIKFEMDDQRWKQTVK